MAFAELRNYLTRKQSRARESFNLRFGAENGVYEDIKRAATLISFVCAEKERREDVLLRNAAGEPVARYSLSIITADIRILSTAAIIIH